MIYFSFQPLAQGIAHILYSMAYTLWLIIKFLVNYFYHISWINLFDFITSLTTCLASCIAIYAFLLKYWPRLWKIYYHGIELNSSMWYGEEIFVIFENKSLASITLESIDLILNNKYKLQISKFKEPFILKPFETVKVGTGYIHSLNMYNGKNISVLEFDKFKKDIVFNIYSTNPKYRNIWTGKFKGKKDYNSYNDITIFKRSFNSIPYDKFVLYAIQYLYNKEVKTILVDKSGLCSHDIYGKNKIPNEVLASPEKLKEFLEKTFPFIKTFGITPLNK